MEFRDEGKSEAEREDRRRAKKDDIAAPVSSVLKLLGTLIRNDIL